MNEFEIYRKAVISELNGFLNCTLAGDVINATTDLLAKKFALTQEQRCAVKNSSKLHGYGPPHVL